MTLICINNSRGILRCANHRASSSPFWAWPIQELASRNFPLAIIVSWPRRISIEFAWDAKPSDLTVIWRLCCLDLDQCDVDPMQLTWNASQPGMAAATPANKVVAVPSITTAPSKIVTICLFIVLSYLLQGLRRGMGAMSIFAKYLV